MQTIYRVQNKLLPLSMNYSKAVNFSDKISWLITQKMTHWYTWVELISYKNNLLNIPKCYSVGREPVLNAIFPIKEGLLSHF